MAAFGLAVLLSGMVISDARLPYLLSGLADALALAIFVHLLLSFPSGHLEDSASRWVVGASYVRRPCHSWWPCCWANRPAIPAARTARATRSSSPPTTASPMRPSS